MEQNNKYYIPKIEDLFEGYEFEYQYYDVQKDEYIDLWINTVFDSRSGLGHDLTHQFNEGTVRVLYLTKQQIEKEGWVHIGGFFWEWPIKNTIYIDEYSSRPLDFRLNFTAADEYLSIEA